MLQHSRLFKSLPRNNNIQHRSISTSNVLLSSKITRQTKYVQQLKELGLEYNGTLSLAKSTLNRFMKHDCKLLGITELGNGNNRNLRDRLTPRLMEECKKRKLSMMGDYVELRSRLKDTDLFKNSISFGKYRLSSTSCARLSI
eukprot:TRINITY_DN12393_c0_g1_i2.p1 TRINITY_DN12393_c0_g1~~TRINITY_DN12393_c0_g1_i2.p1  ORF type:complete len:143 (-),score=9.59 TRINITY_DN12393_c0_g1_i2:60-488(-)